MKYMKFLVVCVVMAAALFISSCDMDTNHRSFAHYLQGTWVPNTPMQYSVTLVITFDRITITDTPGPSQDSPLYRPFRNFPRRVALNGFSEGSRVNRHNEGHIFIDAGGLRPGISYRYSREEQSIPFRWVHILYLDFDGETAIFERREPGFK
ncbi:MAG: hypothetical protein FWB99_08370 [Treponema sp.]|nr:hypothetical protein [Treponema sp.]